jgi:hypothetical protein
MTTLQGKVIRILDERTIMINLGDKDGVTTENIFKIFGEPEEIIDPETQEVLGRLSVTKASVKATQVYERFTIASTRWVERTYAPIISTGSGFAEIFGFSDEERDEGKLNVDPSEVQPWKARSEELVRVGDVVFTEVPSRRPEPANKSSTRQSEGEDESEDEVN